MHFYAWKQGLKTGCYYLRTKAPVMAQKFTVDPRLLAAVQNKTQAEGDEADKDSVYESDADSDEEITTEEKKKAERHALMERLAAEYEAEVQATREAKERGEEVCEMCSS